MSIFFIIFIYLYVNVEIITILLRIKKTSFIDEETKKSITIPKQTTAFFKQKEAIFFIQIKTYFPEIFSLSFLMPFELHYQTYTRVPEAILIDSDPNKSMLAQLKTTNSLNLTELSLVSTLSRFFLTNFDFGLSEDPL